MDTCWVPGINHRQICGRRAFAEFGDVWQMQEDFRQKAEAEFGRILATVAVP